MAYIFQYEFVKNALMAAFLVGVAGGVVGSYVVTKKIVFISGGLAHAVFGGVGLGYLLGINPIVAAVPFSIICAVVMGLIKRKTKISEDTAIGILWPMGMALGVILAALSRGYTPDLFSYLFGNILTVPKTELIIMLVLNVIIILIVALFYKEFLAVSFDEEFATVVGIPTDFIYILLLCLVALSVVVLIRAVGIILVIALLTIPTAISRQFAVNFKKLILSSVVLGIILTVGGLGLSYVLNWASGATIVLVLGFAFFVSLPLKRFLT